MNHSSFWEKKGALFFSKWYWLSQLEVKLAHAILNLLLSNSWNIPYVITQACMFMDLSDINTKDASWTECKKSVTLALEREWTWNILHIIFSQSILPHIIWNSGQNFCWLQKWIRMTLWNEVLQPKSWRVVLGIWIRISASNFDFWKLGLSIYIRDSWNSLFIQKKKK